MYANALKRPSVFTCVCSQAIPVINNVVVTIYGGPTVCTAAGASVGVTFTNNPGNLAAMKVVSNNMDPTTELAIRKGSAFGTFGGQCKLGSRVLTPCSSRGTCNFATGQCQCFPGWGGKDQGTRELRHAMSWPDQSSFCMRTDSDGGGGEVAPGSGAALTNSQAFRDCSYPSGVTSCPCNVIALTLCAWFVFSRGLGWGRVFLLCADNLNTGSLCSGKGTCSGPPHYLCTCQTGYSGGACEYGATCTPCANRGSLVFQSKFAPPHFHTPAVNCPTGTAFWDVATTAGATHQPAQCSNKVGALLFPRGGTG